MVHITVHLVAVSLLALLGCDRFSDFLFDETFFSFFLALVVKNLPANAGHVRDMDLIPASGRSPGGGHGNPLQHSYLENPVDRGAWRATVCGVAQS